MHNYRCIPKSPYKWHSLIDRTDNKCDEDWKSVAVWSCIGVVDNTTVAKRFVDDVTEYLLIRSAKRYILEYICYLLKMWELIDTFIKLEM